MLTGVVDITGNAQSTFSAVSFTTGTGTDLVQPTIVSTTPANGATNVSDTTTCVVVFSEPMDPASFDPNNSLTLRNSGFRNRKMPEPAIFFVSSPVLKQWASPSGQHPSDNVPRGQLTA